MDKNSSLSPLARLKLSRELASIRSELTAASPGLGAIRRLKLIKRANEIRRELGAAARAATAPAAPAEPGPGPQDAPQDRDITILAEVTRGEHDSQGVLGLYDLIRSSAERLAGDRRFEDEKIEALAQEAITHWANVQERMSRVQA